MPSTRQIEFDIVAANRPTQLPSAEAIIQQCRDARVRARADPDVWVRGIPLIDESQGDAVTYAWVKFGESVSLAEARTQNFVAQYIKDNEITTVRVPEVYLSFDTGWFVYIVMEFIDGVTCDKSDADLVTAAVESLIAIPAPTAVPGPIGGGLIGHTFFIDWESSVEYPSVELLQKHINGILRMARWPDRVDFTAEVEAYGLRLCPADLDRSNFLKDRSGRIVAIDYGRTSFLPISFFEHALQTPDPFTWRIRRRVKYPQSTQMDALLRASYTLVPFGTNNIALPRELRQART